MFRAGHLTFKHAVAQDAAANTNTANTGFWVAPIDCELKSVYIRPGSTLTASDTNYTTLQILNDDGAAGTPVEMATLNTKTASGGGSGDWATNVPERMTISQRYMQQGEVLYLAATKSGAGVQAPAFDYCIHFMPLKKRPS